MRHPYLPGAEPVQVLDVPTQLGDIPARLFGRDQGFGSQHGNSLLPQARVTAASQARRKGLGLDARSKRARLPALVSRVWVLSTGRVPQPQP